MNREWQKFLEQAGAQVSDDGVIEFQQRTDVNTDEAVCSLASDVVLRVRGDDAELFLQGQFSNDIASLGDGEAVSIGSQLTTWSSPKGRVLTLFRVIKIEPSHYLMQIPAELVDAIKKRLQMFVMRAKVTFELDVELLCLGVSGDQACSLIKNTVGVLPADVDSSVEFEGSILTRVRGGIPRIEIITTLPQAVRFWQQVAPVCQQSGDQLWRLQNIDAGVPSIRTATTEAFVLQMLNLQHINGVSFKKGCFPGQEVVARMQYLGKLKRRMYRAKVLTAGIPQAGAELFNEGVNSAVGKVVDAQADANNEVRLLAVVSIEAANKPLFTDKEATQSLELLELPYELKES